MVVNGCNQFRNRDPLKSYGIIQSARRYANFWVLSAFFVLAIAGLIIIFYCNSKTVRIIGLLKFIFCIIIFLFLFLLPRQFNPDEDLKMNGKCNVTIMYTFNVKAFLINSEYTDTLTNTQSVLMPMKQGDVIEVKKTGNKNACDYDEIKAKIVDDKGNTYKAKIPSRYFGFMTVTDAEHDEKLNKGQKITDEIKRKPY